MRTKQPFTSALAGAALAISAVSSVAASEIDDLLETAPREYSEKSYSYVDIPQTDASDYRVVQVEFKGREAAEVFRPNSALFYIEGHDKPLDYHYIGEEDDFFSYLTAVPVEYTGQQVIHGLFGARSVEPPTTSQTRDDIVMNKQIIGAPDVLFLVDESGSMGSSVGSGLNRSEVAEQVVNSLVPDLEAKGSRVGVIGYDSSARVILGMDTPSSNMNFSHSGGTGTHEALKEARQMLAKRNAKSQVIIDVTDGVASNSSATADQVQAGEDSGIGMAAIGIGKQVPGYYPYSDYVSDSAANYSLEDSLADLVESTEQRARDINRSCEDGGVCYAEPLDEQGPDVEIFTTEGEGVMENTQDLFLEAVDVHSGVNPEQMSATIKVGGLTVEAPFVSPRGVDYTQQMDGSQGPKQVDYTIGDIANDPEYIEALMSAYLDDRPVEVEVRMRDMEGSSTTVQKSFSFQPPEHTARDHFIASVDHAFAADDGGPTLYVKGENAFTDRAPGGAQIDYVARLTGRNETLNMDGEALSSDAVVPVGSLERGTSLRAALKPQTPGDEASEELVLLPLSPFGKVVRVPYELWAPDVSTQINEPEAVQGITQMSISPQSNSVCRLTDERTARANDAVTSPACFVEWTGVPDELYTRDNGGAGALSGILKSEGVNEGGYRLMLSDGDANPPVEIDSDHFEVDTKTAADALSFGLDSEPDSFTRVVEDVDVRLVQKDGPSCQIYHDEDDAMEAAAKNRPTCLVEWDDLPLGIEGVAYRSAPNADGQIMLKREPTARFSWTAKVILPSGREIALPDGEREVELKDPDAPDIQTNMANEITDSIYGVSQHGGTVGDLVYRGAATDMTVEVIRDGEVVDERIYQGESDSRLARKSRLTAEEQALWTRTNYEVRAHYNLLPEIETSKSFEVAAIPSDSMRLSVETGDKEILDTDSILADLTLSDPFADEGYSPETMGRWDAQMIDQQTASRTQPLTDFTEIDDQGEAQFEFEIEDLNSRVLRLGARATIDSPIEGYEHEIGVNRPTFITVLRGGEIEADLEARRVEGPAPLQVVATAELRDMLDYEAVDEENLVWEQRTDGGEWQEIENDNNYVFRYSNLYEAGTYALRARLVNRYSEAEFVTQALEIHAFDTPEIEIDGPRNAFIDDNAQFSLTDRESGEPLDPEGMEIQWSTDEGETWEVQERLEVTESERTSVMVHARVRAQSAPTDNEEVWSEEKARVSFQPVREPGARMYGPRLVESGESERWEGQSRPPYRDMDVEIVEEVVLPDGTVLDGNVAEYTPTDEDARDEMIGIAYRAWIEGFRDQGAFTEDTQRVRVWDYEWPEWAFSTRKTAEQAPADIEMRLRALGSSIRNVEGMEVEWNIPSEVEILEERRPESRRLSVSEPGRYEITADVSDERGNFTTIRETLNIKPADDWDVSMRVLPSNEHMRAPLEIMTRPIISGGHPRDRADSYRYFVNGELISEESRYGRMELDEGSHEIELEVTTRFGDTVRHTEGVEVVANQVPSCEVDSRQSGSGWRFSAECTDPDGRVRDHRWSVNGEPLSQGGSRISVRADDPSNPPEIELVGIDDAGAESAPVIILPEPAEPRQSAADRRREEREEREEREAEEQARDDERDEAENEDNVANEGDEVAEGEGMPEGYRWPDFEVDVRMRSSQAPAIARIDLQAARGSLRGVDGLSVDWSYPDGVGELSARGEVRRTVGVDYAGDHAVSVQVSDDYGNTSTISAPIEVAEPDRWELSLDLRASNSAMREPLTVRTRPSVRGGHPDDEVESYRYRVNGELISKGSRYGEITLDAGEHDVTLEIETAFGAVEQHTQKVSVAENQPPVCEVDARERRSGWQFRADCSDEDGSIEGYAWEVDGEPVRGGRSRIGVRKDEDSSARPSVTLRAIDDSGEASEPARW